MGIIFSSFNGLEPKIRFASYSENYTICNIGDIFDERSERGSENLELLSVTMNDGVKKRTEIEGKDNSSEDKGNYKIVYVGDMVYNSMRMWQGANGISPYDGIVSPAYTVLKASKPLCNKYIAYLFKNSDLINKFRKNSQGLTSDTWNLKYPQISTIKIYLPSLPEQQKIADFLSLVDARIEKQRRLVESLKKYKRGVIQYYFDNILGERIKLKNILIEVDEKTKINNQHPVISSTKQGLFWQEDYFNKDIASSDNKGYKILRKGQVVFSPQNLWMGNINYNEDFEIGIVSPSYKIYDINKMFDPYFVSVLLKTPIAMKEFFLASEQGASIVRRNLNMDLFENITFQIPSLDKQKDISIRLYKLQKNLDLNIKILDYLIKFKQGLLQQMFI